MEKIVIKKKKPVFAGRFRCRKGKQQLSILIPILTGEFLCGFGENIYIAIYGNTGLRTLNK